MFIAHHPPFIVKLTWLFQLFDTCQTSISSKPLTLLAKTLTPFG